MVGRYTSIAVGDNGNPVIAHSDAIANSLEFYSCDNPICSSGTARTLDNPSDNVGWYISMVIGRDGRPVISYYDHFTAQSLKFYACDDPSCTSGTARTLHDSPSDDLGRYTSIAIGTNGNPVVSYHDATAGALKFYICDNPACTSGSVRTLDDQVNIVGQHTSVVIGQDGYPVISYHDYTAGALKLLKCNDRTCGPVTAIGKSQPSLVPSGLVGYWSFNGPDLSTTTAFDRSGQGNNGTLVGSPKPKPAPGKVGQGLRFQPIPNVDYVNVGSPAIYDNMTALTISSWVRFANLSGGFATVVQKTLGATPISAPGWRLDVSTMGIVSFTAYSTLGMYAPSGFLSGAFGNDWHHVVCTWDGGLSIGSGKIYIDGAPATIFGDSNVGGSRGDDSVSEVQIGGYQSQLFYHFDGILDEVRLYNRVLTPAEVKQLYNAGR
jgi:hypothetical protein